MPLIHWSKSLSKSFRTTVKLSQWFFLACCVGALAGVGSAVLLAALNEATKWREAHKCEQHVETVAFGTTS